MCTVSFIPLEEGFVITSNRDEKIQRETIPPQIYKHTNQLLAYPKDHIAGGTWIAISNQNKAAVLLNGGFEKHIQKNNYIKSRGLVLLQSFAMELNIDAIYHLNLDGVEPFTLLMIEFKNELKFHELVWDGVQKHFKELDTTLPAIWSSVTLYTKENRRERSNWFKNWIQINKQSDDKKIFEFHTAKHSNELSNNVIMKSDNSLQTLSISQIKYWKGEISLTYFDLSTKDTKTIKF